MKADAEDREAPGMTQHAAGADQPRDLGLHQIEIHKKELRATCRDRTTRRVTYAPMEGLPHPPWNSAVRPAKLYRWMPRVESMSID